MTQKAKGVSGLLSSPYPISSSSKDHIRQAIRVGLLIFLALLTFHPFGMNNIESFSYLFFVSFLFGGITVTVVLLNAFILPRLSQSYFLEANWNVLKEIIHILWNFFTVGSANFLVMGLYFGNSFSWYNFLMTQFVTLLVGGFPVALATIWQHNRLLSKALKEAASMQDLQDSHNRKHAEDALEVGNEVLRLLGQSKDEEVEFHHRDLQFVRSDGNYVEVFIAPNHMDRPAVLRNTISSILKQIPENKGILRCHRGYVVNLERVDSYSGNAQGLTLKLKDSLESIPVSRTYLQTVRDYLQS